MKKRDAIIISVLVNAGLLIILFISAITTHDQPKQTLSPDMVSAISDPVETMAALPVSQEPINEIVQDVSPLPNMSMAKEEPAEEPIVHKLPPVEEKHKEVVIVPREKYKEVIVKKGDTLEKIAKFHHTTVAEIERINHLSSHMLRINQVLLVPHAASTVQNMPVSTHEEMTEYYTVKVGDNPWTIAMKHHMKVADLLRLNNLNKEKAKKLRPGMKLRIR